MAAYKIVQITDTHLTADGDKPANHQRVDPAKKLADVFDDIHDTEVNPDLIVISGDLVHNGHPKDYRHFQKYLAKEEKRQNARIQVILGNHDRTKAFYKGFLKDDPKARYFYKVPTDIWDLYFLDTKCGDIEQGYIDADQLEWLQTSLSESSKPAVIFMHHPLAGPTLEHMHYSILQNGDELLKAIPDGKVKAIFAGHIHFAASYQVDGILNVVSDSTAYHIDCSNHHHHFANDATAYSVINLDEKGIGVEQRRLRFGRKTIKTFDIPDTAFVDHKIIQDELDRVRESLEEK